MHFPNNLRYANLGKKKNLKHTQWLLKSEPEKFKHKNIKTFEMHIYLQAQQDVCLYLHTDV